MIPWMIYALAVGVLLALAALLAERGARRAGGPGRWMWVAAIGLTVVLPLLAQWRPTATAAVDRAESAAAIETMTLDPVLVASRDQSLVDRLAGWAREVEPKLARLMGAAGESAIADRIAILLWTLASLVVLGAIVIAAFRLAMARRGWSLALLDEQFVRVSEDVGPAVVGFLRGEIVVPAWTLDLPPERREMLLAHEREHLRARDPLLLLAALIALVMMPWNVALWWQVRRLRLAVEMDCDRRVLRHGGDIRAYGALLIEVGRRSARAPLAAAAFSEPATHLERRIHMMLARTPRWRVLRATALAAAGLGLVIVACDMQPPTGVSPDDEVALATLGANGKSYNVRQGTLAADLRAAIEAFHPELLREQDGQRWIVQLTLDQEGRVISSGKIEEQPVREAVLERAVVEVERAVARLSRVGGEVEVARQRDTLVTSLEARRERELVASAVRADTVRLRANRIALAPGAGNVAMSGEWKGRRLAPSVRMRDTTRGTIVMREVPGTRRLRMPEPNGLEKIDADRIESIEVIKGGVIDGLGPAVSGVIVIRLKY